MSSTAARATPAAAGRDPRGFDQLDGSINSSNSRPQFTNQVIRADLTGANMCSAATIAAAGPAPVLTLCRQLLAAGLDPDTAMQVYRGAALALRVRSIGEAAKLTVRETTSDGRPRFVPLPSGDVGPPMRQSVPAGTEDWIGWPLATDGGRG